MWASLVPGVHRWAERTPGLSRLRMREIFTEIWETVLFWYSSVYGIRNCITSVFFHVIATCSDRDEFSSALVLHIFYTDEGYSVWKP